MKKKLYLVRHATAESSAPMFKDFERELTGEGYIESARMGAYLKSKEISFERIIASEAFRTKQTAQVFAEQIGFDWEQIELFNNLYDCGGRAYIGHVCDTPENVTNLLLVGHNPEISYFAEYLTKYNLGAMGNACVFVIEFDNIPWAEISSASGSFVEYIEPSNLLNQ